MMITYKTYRAFITIVAETNTYHAEIELCRDVITAQSDSLSGLVEEVKRSVEDYEEFVRSLCARSKKRTCRRNNGMD